MNWKIISDNCIQFDDFSVKKTIFHSYVELPEGKPWRDLGFQILRQLQNRCPASWDLLRDVGEGGALMSAWSTFTFLYRLEDDTVWAIASGKRLHNYGKSPCFYG
jgi:hypothetical protein